jgi:hypothetical protein
MTDSDIGADVRQLGSKARQAVTDAATGRAAFTLASTLAVIFRAEGEAIARMRGPAARRIRDEEALTLAGLAEIIRVTPQRAQQLIKSAEGTPQ